MSGAQGDLDEYLMDVGLSMTMMLRTRDVYNQVCEIASIPHFCGIIAWPRYIYVSNSACQDRVLRLVCDSCILFRND
jgi:hypothetical protein